MTTFASDVSEFQWAVDDTYPHKWLIFRACDGTYRDHRFAENYLWARRAARTGKIAGYTVYCVYRPGANTFETVTDMLGQLDAHVTVMIDVESWGGQIRGDHSADITGLANRFATLLGDRRRVIVYANSGDYANLYPTRPSWLRLIVASYGSVQPTLHNMIGWQYSDGETKWPVPADYPRSSHPFGQCDHNVFPGLTPDQLATSLGVGRPKPVTPNTAPEAFMVTAADEAKIRAIVRSEIVDAFKDYTRDDSDPASQQSPGHYMKTIISNEVRQAIPAIAKATADAVKAAQ